eukprot:CAMPEP_0170607340 /NCGR_PEP_ID=MMETSP0224-20130122/21002_1 /TAXON_ID=285029 /ORGANISM="Togula jolla, Strain CCCM 725" /LENGTH=201 /DNA_ID=CAMNT_0010932499 /DNA_START=939 /DNA_END=1541 /DNA_ORIENTATION=-
MAQPIGFGMGYILLEEIMSDYPKEAAGVTAVKLLVVALSSWLFYFTVNGVLPDFTPVLESPTAMEGLLWTGLVTTSLSLTLESVAFRYVDATSASVIFTTEPLWAALFAVWLISEPFGFADGIGGALVVLANVLMILPNSMVPKALGRRSLGLGDIGPSWATAEGAMLCLVPRRHSVPALNFGMSSSLSRGDEGAGAREAR